jgi:hypothetical protein
MFRAQRVHTAEIKKLWGKNIFIDRKICDIGMLCVLFVMTSFVKLNLQFEHVSLVPTELSGIYPLPSCAVLSKKNY